MQSPVLNSRSHTIFHNNLFKRDSNTPLSFPTLKVSIIQKRLKGAGSIIEPAREGQSRLERSRNIPLLPISEIISPSNNENKGPQKTTKQSGLLFMTDFWSPKYRRNVMIADPDAKQRLETMRMTTVTKERINETRCLRRKMTIENLNTNPSQLLEQFDVEGLNSANLKVAEEGLSQVLTPKIRSLTRSNTKVFFKSLKTEGDESDYEAKLSTMSSRHTTDRSYKRMGTQRSSEIYSSLVDSSDERPLTQRSIREKDRLLTSQKYWQMNVILDSDKKVEEEPLSSPRKVLSVKRIKNVKLIRA